MKKRLYKILNFIYFRLSIVAEFPIIFFHEFAHAFAYFSFKGWITVFKDIKIEISIKNNTLYTSGHFTHGLISKRWQGVYLSMAPFLIPLTILTLAICLQSWIFFCILVYECLFFKQTIPSPYDFLNAERAIKDPEWEFNQMFYDKEKLYPDFVEEWKTKKTDV